MLFSLADDTTGIFSIYTVFQGHEIMFHVSTMLPYSRENKQQVRGSLFFFSFLFLIIFFIKSQTPKL